jgi:hypothetical protein
MIRVSQYAPEYDVVPQAIFWRPISYFSTSIQEGEDGLDMYMGISFILDNFITYDIRKYRGHPDYTVSVYLPYEIQNTRQIVETIDSITVAMALPEYAVAWKRGWDFAFGELRRRKEDRLREVEARILALKIAAMQPNHQASTEYIKRQITRYYEPSAVDLHPSATRNREAMWQQIVGNVISHQETSTGLFKRGLAIRTQDGLAVTKAGISYLNSIGFVV